MRIEGLGKPEGCKLIRIKAELEKGVIQSIQIRGDFFASPEEEFDKIEQALEGVRINDAASAFDAFIREKGIETYGISGPGLAEVLNASLGGGADHG
jgi:hypothetical protein